MYELLSEYDKTYHTISIYHLSFYSSCDSNSDPEIYPIRFGQTDYTIRFGVRSSISFVDGGGLYELTASNADVLGKYYIDNDTKTLIVIPTAKGESTLTVTDVKTNTSVTLKFTVEDFYLYIYGYGNQWR